MALPGETICGEGGTYSNNCVDCGTFLPFKVLRSAAGFYVGTYCPHCGPHSRESGYYRSSEEAEKALKSGQFGRE